MNLSFRAKLFLLVGVAIALAALPIIFFSSGYLQDTGKKREHDSFVNTVRLVEDSISQRYMQMLAAEVDSVRIAKEDLEVTGALIRNLCMMNDGVTADYTLEHWKQALHTWNYHFALFDMSGMPLLSDQLITRATAAGVKDFKGQPLQSKFIARPGQADCSFAVVETEGNSGKNVPVLLCFMPVPGKGMLVLGVEIEHIVLSRMQTERGMVESLRERIAELQMHEDASVAVIAGDGTVIASRGKPIALADIPEKALAHARKQEHLEGEGVGSLGMEFLYQLEHFKALDWYIVALISKDAIFAPARELTWYLLSFAAIVFLLSFLVMFTLTARLIQPLQLLTQKAQDLAADDFSIEGETHIEDKIREDMPAHRSDEMGQLASAFAAMGKALDSNIRNLKETLAARQRMEGELNAARDIQMGILPQPDSAPRSEHYSAHAFLEPAKEVGGDLYDFFTAPDGRQVIVIGDVSDKGVSAALFMSMTVTLVRYALAEGLGCAEAMRRINDRLAENNPSCMFVTLFIGVFDPESGELEYASGAHCPPFVVSPDSSIAVRALTDTSGPLVGAMEGMDFEPCHAVIAPGEYCLVYTDGVSEAMDEGKELFTEGRIAEVLDGMREASPEEVLVGVMDALKAHRGKAAQSDDITMICFKRS